MEASPNSGAKHDDAVATRPDAPREIEMKLLAPPGMLDQVRGTPVILKHARNKGITRRLEAIYYDTPDRQLIRNGLTLRVRRSGKHHIQTLKRVSAAGDPLTRHEWEASVETMAPDLTRLPGAEIGVPLIGLAAEALAPVFATKVRRHLQMIDLPDAVVEIAFDDGAIEVGEQREPLCEIELELKEGNVGALYELGLSLLDAAPLRLGMSSKAQRGCALAFGTPPTTEKASDAGIESEDDVDAAVAKLLLSCQRHLMGNLAAAESGDDPEGVHQMRVALRRLRTALTVLRRDVATPAFQAVEGEARHLAGLLGPARSWDVFVTEGLSEIDANLPDVSLDALRGVTEPRRAKSYAALREALDDPRASRFLLSLGRLIERRSWRNDVGGEALPIMAQPATTLADRALTRITRKAIKQGRHFRQLPPEARHSLRLTLKKLRYTTEFFLPLYAGQASAKPYLKRLSRLQDALGADNDVTTTRSLLDDIAKSTSAPDVHRAAGVITGWQGRHQLDAAKALRKTWASFKRARPFWSN